MHGQGVNDNNQLVTLFSMLFVNFLVTLRVLTDRCCLEITLTLQK